MGIPMGIPTRILWGWDEMGISFPRQPWYKCICINTAKTLAQKYLHHSSGLVSITIIIV